MSLKLSPTSITTTPDNKAVVVDAYGNVPTNPTNTITKSLAGVKLPNNINLPGTVKSLLPSADRSVNGLLKGLETSLKTLNPTALTDAIKQAKDALGVDAHTFTKLDVSTFSSILKGFGYDPNNLQTTVDGIAKAVGGEGFAKDLLKGVNLTNISIGDVQATFNKFKDIKSVSDLATLISGISGESDFLKIGSIGATLTALKGITEVASALKIPQVIDKIINSYDKNDQPQLILGLASDANALYDIHYLDTLANTFDTGQILSQNPNIIKQILSGAAETIEHPIVSAEYGIALDAQLKAIDPNWGKCNWGGNWIYDLDVFQSASGFARSCFKLADLYQDVFMYCDDYPPESIIQAAKNYYPMIGILDHEL